MAITINRLAAPLGAEVTGVNLATPVSASVAAALQRALLEHVVLVIRDQSFAPAEYVQAMTTFGTPAMQNHAEQLLDNHPEIWVIDSRTSHKRADGTRVLFGANSWHTDHTNQQKPPKITALYAVKLPSTGGDTCFANAQSMLGRLSATRRQEIESLKVVYGADKHIPLREADKEAFATPAVHPLVRTHPETGRKALYCHPLKAQHVEGWESEPSSQFIDDVIDEALHNDDVFRHEWRLGDLVLIDNRACMHRAMVDYDPEEGRVMHRIIIEGDRPQ
jgi:taurine dioxygenase